ncbi:MAG: hypothetical protein WC309_01695 [Candidatus Paceibacterota bacterium]|jgi:hypothetical protein
MEDVKIIAECSFCGIEKEVIPMIDSDKNGSIYFRNANYAEKIQ